MKRTFSLLTIILIGVILVSDVGLLMKYYQNPKVYSLMEHVSFFHYFLLYKNGVEFALMKVLTSGVLLALWVCRFIYPSRVTVLGYATFVYSFAWVLIGATVLTGITGVLQYSSGLPIRILDLSPLVASMNFYSLLWLVLMIVALPLILMFLPKLHNSFYRSVSV